MSVIKYGYMFWIFLSHPQAYMVTKFMYGMDPIKYHRFV
jgi:hypothetical protein